MREWACLLVKSKYLDNRVFIINTEIIMQVYKFTIAADFLPYIINGDATTFDYWGDFETQEHIDWWLDKNTKELGSGHYSTLDDWGGNFAICDITGVYGNCVLIEYVVL